MQDVIVHEEALSPEEPFSISPEEAGAWAARPDSSVAGSRRHATGRHRRPAALTALAALVVVLVGGGVFWMMQPEQYRATTTLVVLPDASAAEAASYYDTLSQGQITTTIAEILGLRTSGGGPSTDVKVAVVPDTSLIKITATAHAPRTAEALASNALGQAQPYFDQLGAPYAISVVQDAAGTAQRLGLSTPVLGGVVLAVALIAAVATYFTVRALQQARFQGRLIDKRLDTNHVEDLGALIAGASGPPNRDPGGSGNGSQAASSSAVWHRRPAVDPLSQSGL
jgi:capsular polysaccharide biosynthesis protein